jgi:signal peptidase I
VPKRGEIIVFETQGIANIDASQQGSFYIKRLVGLGGDTLRLQPEYVVDDVPRFGSVPVGRVEVNGTVLSASTPNFENLYSFDGVTEGSRRIAYQENRYYGHGALEAFSVTALPVRVPTNNYFVLGDNTMSSSDSRMWGGFAKSQVIGKEFFVYWPLSSRFGFGHR